jgi:hypothetical protein
VHSCNRNVAIEANHHAIFAHPLAGYTDHGAEPGAHSRVSLLPQFAQLKPIALFEFMHRNIWHSVSQPQLEPEGKGVGRAVHGVIRWSTDALLRWLQFALQPPDHLFGFEWIGAFAIEALKRALPLAAGRQRQDQESPTARAGWSFRLAHESILPPLRNPVNSNFRSLRMKRQEPDEAVYGVRCRG